MTPRSTSSSAAIDDLFREVYARPQDDAVRAVRADALLAAGDPRGELISELDLDPVRAWRLGWEAQVTADIIPCTRSEFDEEKHEIDTLPRAAVTRGRKIYER